MDITRIKGLVFISPSTGQEYGAIRSVEGLPAPKGFPVDTWTPFADDDCGNIFASDSHGSIAWWDHETDTITLLAETFSEFCENCTTPTHVAMKPGQVKKVWSDPDFKPEFD